MGDASIDPANLFLLEPAEESTPEFDISDPEVVRTLEESQRTHFWFPARNRYILDFLRRDGAPPPARVLEVGCGTGTVLSALQEAGYEMVGVEMHAPLARRAAARNPSSPIFSLNVETPRPELLRRGPFDAVALFDVIEHLGAPEKLLRACSTLLRPGGLLVGTVPALQILWSDYDAMGGHRRRYDRPSLATLFRQAGLPVPRTSYFFHFLLPGLLSRRLLIGKGRSAEETGASRRAVLHRALDSPVPSLNRAMGWICALERRVAQVAALRRLPGPSLWFSARIPNPSGAPNQKN